MKCETCFYSKKFEVFDPVIATMANRSPTTKEMMKRIGLSSTSEITKCHYAGKPQVVNASEDWCYQWRKK